MAAPTFLPNGLIDHTSRCGENSPYNPENIKKAKVAKGAAIVFGLLARFKCRGKDEQTTSRT